jgi:hypothetical protein
LEPKRRKFSKYGFFQKYLILSRKDIAIFAVFCYNNTEFADSMLASEDRRLPTPYGVLAETPMSPPRDGKRASNKTP